MLYSGFSSCDYIYWQLVQYIFQEDPTAATNICNMLRSWIVKGEAHVLPEIQVHVSLHFEFCCVGGDCWIN